MNVLELLPLAMLRAQRAGASVGVVTDANAAALGLLGLARAEVVGTTLGELLCHEAAIPIGGAGVQVRHPGAGPRAAGGWLAVSTCTMPAGQSSGAPAADVLVVLEDISRHKALEARLDRAAKHDPLTGLINRSELERLLEAIDPDRDGPQVAVIFLDLDGFKRVNDSRGHQAGDELLVAVARRIRAAVRPEDSLARIGGDEFVVVCPRLADPADARAIAERVRATLDSPVSIGGRAHRMSMSLGIALDRADAVDPTALLRKADVAMYRAKDAGGNAVGVHCADMDAELLAEDQVREALGSALRGGGACQPGAAGPGLVLHFQPIVEIASGRLAYVEALTRLRDSSGQMVQPADYLRVAARGGLGAAIGEQVLRRALRQRAHWRSQGVDIPVGLNVARAEVCSAEFADDVMRVLAEEGDRPSAVVVEVGEADLLEATGSAVATLRRLRGSGMGLAVDHFGTGCSSFGVLLSLGPHRVKVDRSLVAGITASDADRAIVTAAVRAAHALGQRVVAEGVETAEQLDVLAGLGCDEAQGFLVSQVLPAAELDLTATRWEPGTLRQVVRWAGRSAAGADVG